MTVEWMDRNNSANTEIISPGQSAPNFLDPKTLALPKMHFIPELFRKRTFPHPNIVFVVSCSIQCIHMSPLSQNKPHINIAEDDCKRQFSKYYNISTLKMTVNVTFQNITESSVDEQNNPHQRNLAIV